MPFPIDWITGTPDDDLTQPFFPDVSGWTKVIKTVCGTGASRNDGPFTTDGGSWSDPENATANDGSANASCVATLSAADGLSATYTEILYLSNFGFAIPDGKNIKAVVIRWLPAAGNPTVTNNPDGHSVELAGFWPTMGLMVDDEWQFMGQDDGDTGWPFTGNCGAAGIDFNDLPPTSISDTYLSGWFYGDAVLTGPTAIDCTDPSDPPVGGMLAGLTGTPPLVLTPAQANATSFGCGFMAQVSGLIEDLDSTTALGTIPIGVFGAAICIYYEDDDGGGSGDPLKDKINFDIQPFDVSIVAASQSEIDLNPFSVNLRTGGFINVDLTMFKKSPPFGGLEVKALSFLLIEKTPQNRQTYELTAVNYSDEYYAHDTDFSENVVIYNGGDAGAGGGDGGTGDGNYRPSLYSDQGQTQTTDPEEAYDIISDTFANISGTYNKGDGQLDCIISYNGFHNLVVHSATTLNIDFSVVINFAGVVQIWLNGESIYHSTGNRSRATLTITVPSGTNISSYVLQFFAVGTPSGSDNTAAIVDLYDIYIVKV